MIRDTIFVEKMFFWHSHILCDALQESYSAVACIYGELVLLSRWLGSTLPMQWLLLWPGLPKPTNPKLPGDPIRSLGSQASRQQHVSLHILPLDQKMTQNFQDLTSPTRWSRSGPALLLHALCRHAGPCWSQCGWGNCKVKICKKKAFETNFPSHRYLINFGVFQMATATMATLTTGVPTGVSGTVRFFQNPFIANDNSRFTVEIVGLPINTAYWVCLLPTNTITNPIVATDFGTGLATTLQPVVSISTFPRFRTGTQIVIFRPWFLVHRQGSSCSTGSQWRVHSQHTTSIWPLPRLASRQWMWASSQESARVLIWPPLLPSLQETSSPAPRSSLCNSAQNAGSTVVKVTIIKKLFWKVEFATKVPYCVRVYRTNIFVIWNLK